MDTEKISPTERFLKGPGLFGHYDLSPFRNLEQKYILITDYYCIAKSLVILVFI